MKKSLKDLGLNKRVVADLGTINNIKGGYVAPDSGDSSCQSCDPTTDKGGASCTCSSADC